MKKWFRNRKITMRITSALEWHAYCISEAGFRLNSCKGPSEKICVNNTEKQDFFKTFNIYCTWVEGRGRGFEKDCFAHSVCPEDRGLISYIPTVPPSLIGIPLSNRKQ